MTWVPALSPRLQAVVEALPLRPGLQVTEIGCGPGAAPREVAERVGPRGHVLAVDRSAKAIAQLTASAAEQISAGRLTARHVAVEDLELDPGEQRYDIAFAVRVGALDGRHPRDGGRAHSSDWAARSSPVGACSSTATTRSTRCSFVTQMLRVAAIGGAG